MSGAPTLPALPAELSIYTAAETRSQWLAWLASETAPLDAAAELAPMDASKVDVVDGAGVQLLLSLDRTLRQRGLALHLGAPSQPLRDACETLGATALLSNGATS